MSDLPPDTTRIGVDIPIDLNERLNKIIPYGNKGRIIVNLLRALEHMIEKNGRECFFDVIDGNVLIATPKTVQNLDT